MPKPTSGQLSVILAAPLTESYRSIDTRAGTPTGTARYWRGKLLGEHRRPRAQTLWTDEDLRYLCEHAEDSSVVLAHRLGRSVGAILTRRAELLKSGEITIDTTAMKRKTGWMPKTNPTSPVAMTRLSEAQTAKLNALSDESHLPRTEVLRMLIEMATAEQVMEQWRRSHLVESP